MASACPGCGAVIEHSPEDVEKYYGHILTCDKAKALTVGPAPAAISETGDTGSPSVGPITVAIQESANTQAKETHMSTFFTILGMIPSIIGIIRQVEEAIPQKGAGPHKLDTVLNTVNVAVQSVPAVAQSLVDHDINGTVTSIVNATVASMNAAKAQATVQ